MSRFEWLFEVHETGRGIGNEAIPFHVIVVAQSPELAYNLAQREYRKVAEAQLSGGYHGWPFPFEADEAMECIPGYLWQWGDGSDWYYEARRLRRVHEGTPAGPAGVQIGSGNIQQNTFT